MHSDGRATSRDSRHRSASVLPPARSGRRAVFRASFSGLAPTAGSPAVCRWHRLARFASSSSFFRGNHLELEHTLSTRSASIHPTLLIAGTVITVGFLTTTLAQPRVLVHIPLQNLLKNVLHTDRSTNAAFFFWVGLPWYIKPLLGVLSDAFPIFGSRRKSYILIGALAAVAAWLSLITATHSYSELLLICMIANFATVVASTALGGYLVEAAHATSAAGRLTSLRNFAMQFSYLVAGPAGGFLGTLALGWAALACGGIAFLIVPLAWWLIRESHQPPPAELLHEMGRELRVMVRA